MQKQLSHHEFKTQQKENKNDIIFVLDNLNLMIYDSENYYSRSYIQQECHIDSNAKKQ